MATEIDYHVKNVVERFEEKKLVLRAEYKAYTPWLGGCAWAKTIKVKNGIVEDVCLPDSKGLVGRARWLARVAIATSIRGAIKYEQVEGPVKKIFGSTDRASALIIRLTPKEDKDGIIKRLSNVLGKIFNHRNLLYGDLLDTLDDAFNTDMYSRLEGNPRIELLQMGNLYGKRKHRMIKEGKFDEVLGKLPLPPEAIKGFILTVKKRLPYHDIPASVPALIILTPLILGLGASTTRGFGRFCLENLIVGRDYESSEIIKMARKLASCNDLANLKPEDIKKNLYKIIKNIGNDLDRLETNKEGTGKHDNYSYVPVLESIDILGVRGDITDALNKINRAVLKQEWKKCLRFSVHKPGLNFHTWVLGLPRSQKTGGYIILERGGNDMKGNSDWDCLDPSRLVNRNLGRRISPVHIFPLPAYTDGIINVVVVTFKSYDFNKDCDDDSKKILNNLYHYGKYILKRRDNKITWSKDYYIKKITYIVRNPVLINHCKKRGRKPLYRGGIIKYSVYRKTRQPIVGKNLTNYDIIDHALEAALEFIKCVLRGDS